MTYFLNAPFEQSSFLKADISKLYYTLKPNNKIMRRILHSKIFLLLVAITLLFTSCKKGDPGAAGAPGATGQTGPTGPTGVQGPKGDTGTANVIYSAWLNVTYQ